MPLLPQDLAAQQWSQLITIIQNEMQVGGRLATLQDLRKGWQLWTGKIPAMGVQLTKIREEPAVSRKHLVTTTFQIIVAANSTDVINGDQKTPANLDAAMATLQTLISDGSGNGLAPVLRDPANYFLNGYAMRTSITDIDYLWDVEPGETPQIWAYASVTYIAKNEVAI